MIIVTQSQLRNKDTEAIILLRNEIKDSTDDKSCTVREKLIDIANLMDIASYFNSGWEYDVTEEVVGYSIAYYKFVENRIIKFANLILLFIHIMVVQYLKMKLMHSM